MRKFSRLFLPILAALIGACGPAESPVLGVPQDLQSPTKDTVAGPRLSGGSDGTLVLSWMEPRESGATLRYSSFSGDGFSSASDVTNDELMFVNWADLPSVTQVAGAHWIAHWLRYSANETYAYDVVVAQSFDGGESWTDAVKAHDDGTQTEHGFVSMHRRDDGIALLWLDGRATPDASMTLRSAVITPAGERTHEKLVDDSVCDCCQTDTAISSRGPIAVYRDRTSDEIRDIFVTRQVDGQWQPGERLYADDWHIAGCPVNGPSIVASRDRVAIAWFSAANDQPVVRLVTSDDGGATFGTPIEIASGHIAGYSDIALLDDASVVVSWVSRGGNGENRIHLRHVTTDSRAGPPLTIGTTSQLRVFPQLGYSNGALVIVWTDETDQLRQLHAAQVPVLPPS